jgi:hypothetical protein
MEIRESIPALPATVDSAQGARKSLLWLPVLLLVLLIPLCFLGYGSDNDTYGVLDCGISTWHLHIPRTSRNPGYWTYEAITYVLSTLGGSLLCNFASLAMAVLVLWRFWKLSLRLGARFPALLAACLIVTPGFIISATSTDDYLWSLLFMVLGAEMIVADRLVAATFLSALAMAIRGGNGPIVACGYFTAIAYEIYTSGRVKARAIKIAFSGLVAALIAGATFYPSYLLAGRTTGFTKAMDGPPELYTPFLRVGKFLYKGSVAFGPFALLVILVATALYLRRRRNERASAFPQDARQLTVLCWGYFLGNLILFFRYPIEFYYLIPATFFFLLLAGITIFRNSRALTVALLVTILSFDFVWPIFVRPNVPGRSTGARLHFGFDPGILIMDVHARIKVKDCRDSDCFTHRSQ